MEYDDSMGKRERPEPDLDLADVLLELGHTPESFARAAKINASGLRRAIRGESMMSHRTAKIIANRLVAEGLDENDPQRIAQLSESLGPYPVFPARREGAGLSSAPAPHPRVSVALANLMKALGRKEVDRVYTRVFGFAPYEKDK